MRLRACQHENAIDHKAMHSIATGETAVHRGRTAFGLTLEADPRLVATGCRLVVISEGYYHRQAEGFGDTSPILVG